jgi:D-alanyl-D-alanine dipeptidase
LFFIICFTYIFSFTAFASDDISISTFELPIHGATGFVTTNVGDFTSGEMVVILKDGNISNYSKVPKGFLLVKKEDGTISTVSQDYVLVNLPDIIPSIIYKNTNSYSSMFRTSGEDIENLTGEQLYNSKFYNKRFNQEQYVMPIMYATAHKIMNMQQLALQDGNTLVIYETYRPHEVQQLVKTNLSTKISSNFTLMKNVNYDSYGNYWGAGWFIAQGYSNHQRGIALDVSLAKIECMETSTYRNIPYTSITKYSEYDTPSPMHELSSMAVIMKPSTNVKNIDTNNMDRFYGNVTDGAILLQNYAIDSGMYPLLSEWWHFNDSDTKKSLKTLCNGDFYVSGCMSY